MNFTKDQRDAIAVRRCNVLVSAAAGSGKTGVLTERIISRLREGEDIDELLVLTFTRAAAGEMKKRVRDKIAHEAETDDESRRAFWQRQLSLIGDAPITTIHSFCLRLLRRHYHLLPGLDPKFRITSEKRSAMLRDDLLASYLEECYTHPDETLRNRYFDLLRLYGSRLSDDGLKKEILNLLDFGSAQGDPVEWLDFACRRFGDFDFWHEAALTEARNSVRSLFEETDADLERMIRLGGSDGCITMLRSDRERLGSLLGGGWDDFAHADVFCDKPRRKKEDDPDLDAFCANRRNRRKEYFKSHIAPLFARPFSVYAGEIAELLPMMETLAGMTKDFYERYQAEKLKKSALDFSDLEYYALKLLTENTALSAEYRHLFKEVLVDEYQDINPLQNQLLSLLAGEDRFFAVGDIKQSIYGFRLADHRLFRDRALSYGEDAPNENGRLIRLNMNFRSRREVLSLTNAVFTALMNEELSGIGYGEKEALHYGAAYYEEMEGTEAEIAVIELPASDTEGEFDALACQGRFIAAEIEKMMGGGFLVTDQDGPRPLRYGDITVLMRSANRHGEELADPLKERNIPVRTPAAEGFLSGRETKLLASFLAVLDNPMQDIPLAAVMRSPLFGFDENELLLLSLDRKGKKLWEMVLVAEELGRADLDVEKTASFRETIRLWRRRSRIYPVGDLVDDFIKTFDYAAFWGGLPGGRRRIANIRLFAEEAMNFQMEDGGGLFDFLRYLDHLEKNRGDVPESFEDDEDCVHIMNIHHSKGLEFPVVFVARTEQYFNKRDMSKPLLVDGDYGFGPQYKDGKLRQISSSLPRLLIKERKNREELAEEMRVLYVALTRAKEKLIVIASDKATAKTTMAEKIAAFGNERRLGADTKLPATALLSDSSYYRWLLRCLGGESGSGYQIKIVPAMASLPPKPVVKQERILPAADFERLAKTLSRSETRRLPAKVSVTSLLPEETGERETALLRRPRSLSGGSLTAAEKGTVFHLVMEKIPLDVVWREENLRSYVAALAEKGVLTETMTASLDLETILSFFHSRCGRELLKASVVRRELSFVGGFTAEELFPEAAGDKRPVILQGAVDLLYQREDGGWVLVDYKTNDLRRRGADAFLAKYRRQIELYTAALSRVYHIDVDESFFYLTAERRFLPCN